MTDFVYTRVHLILAKMYSVYTLSRHNERTEEYLVHQVCSFTVHNFNKVSVVGILILAP